MTFNSGKLPDTGAQFLTSLTLIFEAPQADLRREGDLSHAFR